MAFIPLNNANSTLASGINSSVTTITVQTGDGALFAVGSDYSYVTLEDAAGNIEVCKLTGQMGDALTVVRGQDGTTARSWVSGDAIEARPCAAAIEDIITQVTDAGTAAVAAHLADTVDAHDASAISYAGSTGLVATDVEAALDELDAEKRNSADDVVLAAGKVVSFEGTTADDFETVLSAEDPTQDNTITLPNASGTVALTSVVFQPTVRQTVLTGPVGPTGYAQFLTSGSGLRPGLEAAATPVVVTFARGFGQQGAVDLYSEVSADAADMLGADLPAHSLSYLYATYASPTSVTWGATLFPPQYGRAYNRAKQALLRFEGTDASTTIIDDYGNLWGVSGNAQIDTAVQIDGLNTLLCDGTDDYIITNDITTLSPDGWTVEWKMQFNSVAAVNDILCMHNSSGYGFMIRRNNGASSTLTTYASSSGTSHDIASSSSGTLSWATGTTYHFAACYDTVAGKYYVYLDGVKVHEVSSTAQVCQITRVTLGAQPSGATDVSGAYAGFQYVPYCKYPDGQTFTVPDISTFAVGGHFFNTTEMKMYEITSASTTSGVNPGMTQRDRVFVGEAITTGSVVSSRTSYAYRGDYEEVTGTSLPAVSTKTVFSHNIGVTPREVVPFVRCVTTDLGYLPGDEVAGLYTGNATWGLVHGGARNRLAAAVATGSVTAFGAVPSGGGAQAAFTAARWTLGMRCNRGW